MGYPMDKFRFLPHTADAKFQAFGKSLEETFVHAAYAVASLMWDFNGVEDKAVIPVEVEGKDLEQLLVRFLEEILYHLDTKNFLLGSIDGLSLLQEAGVWKIKASFNGAVNAGKHEIYGDVKAITYNEIKVKNRSPYMVQVVVDV
jgi:SHS2 domain-containing protein